MLRLVINEEAPRGDWWGKRLDCDALNKKVVVGVGLMGETNASQSKFAAGLNEGQLRISTWVHRTVSDVEVYVDGTCLPTNPGPGGWAALITWGETAKELVGLVSEETTNQRMELTAVIEALKILNRQCTVCVYTGSQYVQRGMTEWIEGWKSSGRLSGNDIANSDLWIRLDELSGVHKVNWVWVKRSTGNEATKKVDLLAHEAARRARDELTSGLNT